MSSQRPTLLVMLLVALLATALRVEGAGTLTDLSGQSFTLKRPATRIISLSPAMTENLFAAGARYQVVATAPGADFPVEAYGVPVLSLNPETFLKEVQAFHPEILIAEWKELPADIRTIIEENHLPVYKADITHIRDIIKLIRDFSTLMGSETGIQLASDFEKQLLALQIHYQKSDPVTVFYQWWKSPLYTINRSHFINEAIELCGGVNVFADQEETISRVSIEALIEKDPRAIVAGGSQAAAAVWHFYWWPWPGLKAVRFQNLYFINQDEIARPTPRIILGITRLCEALDHVRYPYIYAPKLTVPDGVYPQAPDSTTP